MDYRSILGEYYASQYRLPIVILRPFSVYGPRGRFDMLPNLLLKSTNDNLIFSQFGSNKNNRRDWTYIDDLVNLVISIIDNYRFKTYEILNIGRSKAVGIEDFIHIFSSLLKKNIRVMKLPLQKMEIPVTLADMRKTKKVLKSVPQTTIKNGLKSFINSNN